MKWILLAMCLLAGCSTARGEGAPTMQGSTPVILDTDIGNDIDDNWAVAMLLRSPSLDLKLVTTTDGLPDYRARLAAKLLTAAGRTDVPIALGPVAGKSAVNEQEAKWIADFPLSAYRGTVSKDAVRSIIDTVNHSTQTITIIAIGPLQTLAAVLEADPSIARKCNLVAMEGAVFRGYEGANKPEPEFNVKLAIPEAKKVLSAPWKSIAITPLDTCGLPGVDLAGENYAKVQRSSDPLMRAVIESYAAFQNAPDTNTLKVSTRLFDTVAIYLARPNHDLLHMEDLKITVRADGRTAISPDGTPMGVATQWNDLDAYQNVLLDSLIGNANAK